MTNDNILRWSCGEPVLPHETYQQHVDYCPWMRWRDHPNDFVWDDPEENDDE